MLIRNSFSQLLGRFSSLIAGVIAAPVYMAYLGAEAYGIVGIYIAFFSFFSLFDFGLPVSANRQISVFLEQDAGHKAIYGLIRAFELVIVSVGIVGGLLFISLSGYLTDHWLNIETLSHGAVQRALVLASIAAMLRFPTAFYCNVQFAFDKHFSSNLITAIAAVLRVVLSVTAFKIWGASLQVFFLAQMVANAFEVIALMGILWGRRHVPFFTGPSWHELKKSMGMTLSLTGISITALLQSQIDKVLLSTWLPLSDFGVYSLSYSLAMGILPIAYAVGNATFPPLSRMLAGEGRKAEIVPFISRANTLIVLGCFPVGIILATHIELLKPILAWFTKEGELLAALLPWMFMGALAQSCVVMPHHYRVAEGRPQIVLWVNIAFILPYAAMLYILIKGTGTSGAAHAFFIINVLVAVTHWATFIFSGSREGWIKIALTDSIFFLLYLPLLYVASFLTVRGWGVWSSIAMMACEWLVCCFIMLALLPELKQQAGELLSLIQKGEA